MDPIGFGGSWAVLGFDMDCQVDGLFWVATWAWVLSNVWFNSFFFFLATLLVVIHSDTGKPGSNLALIPKPDAGKNQDGCNNMIE